MAALVAGPVAHWYAGLSLGAVALAWFLTTPLFAGSLALGALLEAVNFRSLRRGWARFFQELLSGDRVRGFLAVSGIVARFLLLMAAVGLSLYAGAHPVGLLIGLSLIIPATLIAAWATRPAVDSEAAALDPDDPSWETWNPWLAREGREDEDDA